MKPGQKKGERWGVWITCPCGKQFYRSQSLAQRGKFCSKVCKYKYPKKTRPALYRAYRSQKDKAAVRGINFLLSFEEWLDIWTRSGFLSERGRLSEAYCMARFGDVGPYSRDNVKIIKTKENCSERIASDKTIERMRLAHTGRKHTEETKIKMRLHGRPHSEETKQKLRDIWERRRAANG